MLENIGGIKFNYMWILKTNNMNGGYYAYYYYNFAWGIASSTDIKVITCDNNSKGVL